MFVLWGSKTLINISENVISFVSSWYLPAHLSSHCPRTRCHPAMSFAYSHLSHHNDGQSWLELFRSVVEKLCHRNGVIYILFIQISLNPKRIICLPTMHNLGIMIYKRYIDQCKGIESLGGKQSWKDLNVEIDPNPNWESNAFATPPCFDHPIETPFWLFAWVTKKNPHVRIVLFRYTWMHKTWIIKPCMCFFIDGQITRKEASLWQLAFTRANLFSLTGQI